MTQAMCNTFKKELWEAKHNFLASGGHVFKIALYTSTASLGAGTDTYSSTDEVSHASYTAGGFTLTNVNPSLSGNTVMVTFSSNPVWNNITLANVTQALIWNTSVSNRAVAVLDFGGNQPVTSGTFTINLPPVTSTTALLRLT